jgi:two-component system, OmpR family, response regulator ResD
MVESLSLQGRFCEKLIRSTQCKKRDGESEMRKILIVDDEEKIREVLVSYLEKEGYATLEAANGTEALKLFNEEAPDLVILDLMLPDVSGETVCQRIRGQSPVPILMLTAKISEGSRIEGFALGADDYVIKPFSPREVVARLKAILRRSHQDLLASRISYRDGELMIDTNRKEVFIRGEAVSLTPAEFKLLLILARHPDRSFSREELIEKAFGMSYMGDDRIIDQHIKNLRQKIEPNPKKPQYIITVYGFGYRFASKG